MAIRKKKESLYKILQISEEASTSEIKSAYKRLARQYHPDIVANSDDEEVKKESKKMMTKLNIAKDTLLDSTKRAEYDVILNELQAGKTTEVEIYENSDYLEVFELDEDVEFDSDKPQPVYELDDDFTYDDNGHPVEVEEIYSDLTDESELAPDQDRTPSRRDVFAFCPRCGAENVDDKDYCFNCSMRLVYYKQSHPKQAWVPTPRQEPPRGVREISIIECPNCGARNFAESHQCYFCNMSFTRPSGPGFQDKVSRREVLSDEELMACPKCGAGNMPGSAFCRICHADIRGYHKQTTDSGSYQEPDYDSGQSRLVNCPNCGAVNFEYSQACYFCKASLIFYQPPIEPEEPKVESTKKIESPDSVILECPKCEHEVFPEQTYCYYCGYKFRNVEKF